MATKVYVTNPQLTVTGASDEFILGYSALVCETGLPAVLVPPGNDSTIVFLAYGDNSGVARQKIIDNVILHFGVTSNDIFFIPEIGAAV